MIQMSRLGSDPFVLDTTSRCSSGLRLTFAQMPTSPTAPSLAPVRSNQVSRNVGCGPLRRYASTPVDDAPTATRLLPTATSGLTTYGSPDVFSVSGSNRCATSTRACEQQLTGGVSGR
jgi:hypothetical protein